MVDEFTDKRGSRKILLLHKYMYNVVHAVNHRVRQKTSHFLPLSSHPSYASFAVMPKAKGRRNWIFLPPVQNWWKYANGCRKTWWSFDVILLSGVTHYYYHLNEAYKFRLCIKCSSTKIGSSNGPLLTLSRHAEEFHVFWSHHCSGRTEKQAVRDALSHGRAPPAFTRTPSRRQPRRVIDELLDAKSSENSGKQTKHEIKTISIPQPAQK